jgi:hypothetical protein
MSKRREQAPASKSVIEDDQPEREEADESSMLVAGTNLTSEQMAEAMEDATKKGRGSPLLYTDVWWDQWDPARLKTDLNREVTPRYSQATSALKGSRPTGRASFQF